MPIPTKKELEKSKKGNRFELKTESGVKIRDFSKVPSAELFSKSCVWNVFNIEQESMNPFTGEQLESLVGVAPHNLPRRIKILRKQISKFTKDDVFEVEFAYWNGVRTQHPNKYKAELERSEWNDDTQFESTIEEDKEAEDFLLDD